MNIDLATLVLSVVLALVLLGAAAWLLLAVEDIARARAVRSARLPGDPRAR